MSHRLLWIVSALLAASAAQAQFVLQHSGSTASLRGISAVNRRVAWASGTGGTVLRTVNGGNDWTTCATPTGAEKLDFRAVQAFDDKTAIVMSIGAGDSSRLYKTTDGCQTWRLMYSNPDTPNGFFDAILFASPTEGWLLGDPVKGAFFLAHTEDDGATWQRSSSPDLALPAGAKFGAFAASNQSLTIANRGPMFGAGAGWIYGGNFPSCSQSIGYNEPDQCFARMNFRKLQTPVGGEGAAAGVFAMLAEKMVVVGVGGDYTKPDAAEKSAAYSRNGGYSWQAAATPPHGYRSSVVFYEPTKAWLAVGPNGSDVSFDDGETWRALRPAATDAPDADRNWNALSLPFVVGPKGRIGVLRDDVLTAPKR